MLDARLRIVQHHLDSIETGWHVGMPETGADPDVVVLENPGEKKMAHAVLPQKWFDGGMRQYIEWEIRRALNDTKVK